LSASLLQKCDGGNVPQATIWAAFWRLCQQVTYEVNFLPADILAIATQRLANAKYQGSQILLRTYPAQRGIGAVSCCLTGQSIGTQQH
jgi:hypothetical protein